MNSLKNWNVILLLKWIAFNAFMLFMSFLAYGEGYISLVFSKDVSNISYLITGVFVVTMALIFFKVWQTSLEIRSVSADFEHSKSRKFLGDHHNIGETYKSEKFRGTSLMQFLTSVPVTLGLIGTIVGFILMLNGIPEAGAGNAAQASKMVVVLTTGMGTALYTTLAGSVLSLWLQMNFAIMRSGLIELVNMVNMKDSEKGLYQKFKIPPASPPDNREQLNG